MKKIKLGKTTIGPDIEAPNMSARSPKGAKFVMKPGEVISTNMRPGKGFTEAVDMDSIRNMVKATTGKKYGSKMKVSK